MTFKPRPGGPTLKEMKSALCQFFPKDISENICDHVYRCKFDEALKEISEIKWEIDPYSGSCRQIPGKRIVQYFMYAPGLPPHPPPGVACKLERELFDILRVYSNKNDLRIQRNNHRVVVVTEW